MHFAKLDGEFINVQDIVNISNIKHLDTDGYEYYIKLRNGTSVRKYLPPWTKVTTTTLKRWYGTVVTETTDRDSERIEQDLIKLTNSRDVFINQVINPGANVRLAENAPVNIIG